MVESVLYNVKFLEDLDFIDFKIFLKVSDVMRIIEVYRMLWLFVIYFFYLGVMEVGNFFSFSIKFVMVLGGFLMEGIGDMMRVFIIGELENEIKVV